MNHGQCNQDKKLKKYEKGFRLKLPKFSQDPILEVKFLHAQFFSILRQ